MKRLTKDDAIVGLPVAATGYRGEIISSPQLRDGVWCVLVTGIGDWLPVWSFTDNSPYAEKSKTKRKK